VDRENEVAPPPKVDMAVGKAIAKARAGKTPPMKQSELAQKINEKPSVINGTLLSFGWANVDYENGKAIPNQQILGKMERVLGVKLRGKDIGAPLEDKHAAKK
jgi:putative transcription factor